MAKDEEKDLEPKDPKAAKNAKAAAEFDDDVAQDDTSALRVETIGVLSSTIPGGAVLGPDGTTWLDAHGNPLTPAQVKEAKAHQALRREARASLNTLLQKEAGR